MNYFSCWRVYKFLDRERTKKAKYSSSVKINSDEPSEDKGFNPSHKQTSGGYSAYEHGESPKTYLTKENMLKKVIKECLELQEKLRNGEETLQNFTPKPYLIMSYITSLTSSEIMKKLKSMKKEELFNTFFKFSGFHYTGNFYMRTAFYKCISREELFTALAYIFKEDFKPPTYEQMKIQF